jgi:hypothetical protein
MVSMATPPPHTPALAPEIITTPLLHGYLTAQTFLRLAPNTSVFDCVKRPSNPSELRRAGQAAGPTGTSPFSLRKEVIQPQVLLQLPCYDFTPITSHTLGTCPLAVSSVTSSTTSFHDVTGGVYKARERIHRGMLIRDY